MHFAVVKQIGSYTIHFSKTNQSAHGICPEGIGELPYKKGEGAHWK